MARWLTQPDRAQERLTDVAKSSAKTTRPAAPTAAQRRLSAQRAAAARERIQSSQRRRRLIAVVGAVGAVIVLVAALLIARAVIDKSPKSGTKATAASVSVTQRVASVPLSVFNKIGAGDTTTPPKSTGDSLLTSGGKPSILFVGAEFCPYCAGERWAVATALSRFGTFHNLGEVRSSPSDVYPSTATLSFHGSTFSSKYLSFAGKEVQSNQVVGDNYGSLDKLNTEQTKLFAKASGYPYLNIAGKYTLNEVQYNPGLLKGKNQEQIATALSDPNSPIAKGVIGSANRLTATICKVTGQQPTSVCSSAGVKAASG